MSGIAWRLAATVVFVLLNGFFVAAEFSLVKVRPMKMAVLARNGSRSARVVQEMLGRLNLYLSACQLGITLASLILGWLAEPAVANLLIKAADAVALPVDQGIIHAVSLAIALTVVTVLHMTVGEQAPKIWSIHRAETMALRIAYPLWTFTLVFRPLIWLVNSFSNGLVRIAGLSPEGHAEAPPDAGEIKDLLSRSASAGHITNRQGEFARNVIGIARLEVRHILVPRVQVVSLSLDDPQEESLRRLRQSGHSRFPLCRGDLDSVIGIVHAKAVLTALVDGRELNLEALARKPVFIPETQKVSRMIHELQQAGSGCAVAVDEYGGVQGLAFLEDAIEEIVGPIRDEFDSVEEEYREISPGVLELDGGMDLPTACELLGMEECGDEDTIGGYVTGHLGRLPVLGDRVELGPFMVEVIDVRNRRARTIRATRVTPEDD